MIRMVTRGRRERGAPRDISTQEGTMRLGGASSLDDTRERG